jgi:pilus assembly protein Flp/PilA
MENIMKNLKGTNADESGATATEYIILLILIACVSIAIVKVFGETVRGKFDAANQGVETEVKF